MTFTYDRDNNMTSVTDADNNTTNLAYDEDGRITNQSNANGSSTNSSYDNYGNLSQEVLSNGPTYNYNYDLERKITGASMTGGSSYVYGYDAVGNLISLLEKDASGNTVTTINSPSSGSMYSNKDEILGYNFTYKGYSSNPIPFSYSYNPAGLIETTTGDGKKFTFNYDESNNPVSRENPNNTTDTFAYNGANQTTGIQTLNNNNDILLSNNYTYDKDGRVTSVTGNINGNSTSASYTYNNGTEKLNRLTNAVINDGTNKYTFNYSYDATGNILSMDAANGTNINHSDFTYDADNRITNSGFEYDKDGNLTKAVFKGIQYQYEYDAEDRLITVKNDVGSIFVTYTYDAEGNRLTKTSYLSGSPVTTTYHYYNGEVLYETLSTDPANIIHALYIRTPQGAIEGVSINYQIGSPANNFYYYHYNAHGDVIGITDSNGILIRQYVYDPYGNIIDLEDGYGNQIYNDTMFDDCYLYAGYLYDQEVGLYYLKARYYAPGLGRFLTKDSEIDVSNAKSLNAYVYCQDDPVNLADRDGCRPVVSDDGGQLVLGYSSTEGHHHSSSTSVYRNGSGSTKKTVKKQSITKTVIKTIATTGVSEVKSICEDLSKPSAIICNRAMGRSTEMPLWVPGSSAARVTGDVLGVIGVAATCYGLYSDFKDYGNTREGWTRFGIDLGVAALTIGAGILLPGIGGILIGATLSVGGSICENAIFKDGY